MWLLFGIQLGTAILFLLLGFGLKRGAYWLISGYSTRSSEEQKQLIENGYPQKTANLLIGTGVGMMILIPLMFTSFPYAMEVIFGFMMLYLLVGFIYLSRFEVPNKRKMSYIISISIGVATFVGIGILMVMGFQDAKLIVKEDSFEITGMYGDTWSNSDIIEVNLLKEMPDVTWKVNGFGLETVAKGKFKVDGFGSSLLFIQKNKPPYLHIKTKNEDIFINSEDPSRTRKWRDELSKRQK